MLGNQRELKLFMLAIIIYIIAGIILLPVLNDYRFVIIPNTMVLLCFGTFLFIRLYQKGLLSRDNHILFFMGLAAIILIVLVNLLYLSIIVEFGMEECATEPDIISNIVGYFFNPIALINYVFIALSLYTKKKSVEKTDEDIKHKHNF